MSARLSVPVRRLPHAANLPLPAYATEGSAGVDLLAAIREPVIINPGERALIPSGIALALPRGFEAQVRPRSGLALKYGVTVLNSPGTVDSDYRGEISIILINLGDAAFSVEPAQRIAQLVIASVTSVDWQEVASLPETARGAGGYGSTGEKIPEVDGSC